MFRPLLAFLTLCLAAFLLAPTVASVHERVDRLSIDRPLPWQIWKWETDPTPPPFGRPDCDYQDLHLFSEVDKWPEILKKGQNFTLGGIVTVDEEEGRPIWDVEVDLFLNETKEEPGLPLGRVITGHDGRFTLTGALPYDAPATRYHIVAHANTLQRSCKTYHEHWSDPEMDVVSKTTIELDPVEHAVAGREFNLTGHLRDQIGAPVRGVPVNVTIDDKKLSATTDQSGAFTVNYTSDEPGTLAAKADYRGNKWYEPSKGNSTIQVRSEDFVLDQAEHGLELLRSNPSVFSGQAFLAASKRTGDLAIVFSGVEVIACEGCEPAARVTAKPDDEGRFSLTLVAPPTQRPGAFNVTITGGGLTKSYAFNGSVVVPTEVHVDAVGAGLFSNDYVANVTFTDETGRALTGTLAVLGPNGWNTTKTDASGVLLAQGETSCGQHGFDAFYNGSTYYRPSTGSDDANVCGFLAFVPAWVFDVPWWAWLLTPLVGLGAWYLIRRARDRYAPTISAGPPLTLTFTEPADNAAGWAGIGEVVVATAFLESPLPDGHTLRLGAAGAMEMRPIDAELRASWRFEPTELGVVPVRAEILDPKGRVVTRRTAHLRVVRYAEEIEERYLALRKSTGASEAVTPREFEAWLRERAPALDHDTARRLIRIFEEADYSPRDAGRADFAAYLAAERGIEEVSPRATIG